MLRMTPKEATPVPTYVTRYRERFMIKSTSSSVVMYELPFLEDDVTSVTLIVDDVMFDNTMSRLYCQSITQATIDCLECAAIEVCNPGSLQEDVELDHV